ncbi:flagellar export chaperone FliS [Fodinisporobacter ferrooxydans]|uniref:Flagellar secretion chaperone FliS n=1 Tax=Fodinisporobacter ferrooxydans TaxID=2901836 RepID=A0ABY4CLM6_9BACL|nr:flagellar export chaperone FliS [Alicyclobacillaceae bacterium MYW30-H2]
MKGIQAYQQSAVQTSPSKLLIMLFDGLIKFSNWSQQMMREKKYELAHANLLRAQNILIELMTTLNKKAAPELCDHLYGLYDFMYRRLIQANMEKNPELIDLVIQYSTELRDTFNQAALIASQSRNGK